MMRGSGAVVPFLLFSACVQTTTTKVAPDVAPRRVTEVEAWQVVAGAQTRGRLVLLRVEDPKAPVELYRVENPHGQWVGWIDASGRVFRREPFQADSVLVTTTTVAKGVGVLLNTNATVELVPVPPPEKR
jgi:hypothetical protein